MTNAVVLLLEIPLASCAYLSTQELIRIGKRCEAVGSLREIGEITYGAYLSEPM